MKLADNRDGVQSCLQVFHVHVFLVAPLGGLARLGRVLCKQVAVGLCDATGVVDSLVGLEIGQ